MSSAATRASDHRTMVWETQKRGGEQSRHQEPTVSHAVRESLHPRQRRRPRIRRRPPIEKSGAWLAVGLTLVGVARGPLHALALPPPCSPATAEFVVRNAVGLAALVAQTNCSEGDFRVSWEGHVSFEEPIVVGNATRLTITGLGDGAALDGGGATRLIVTTGGSSLLLENLELRNGSGPQYSGGGGAIASDGAQITIQATSCNFTNNRSPLDGGAIVSTGGQSVMEFSDCRFEGNYAAYNGGAVSADGALELVALDTVFIQNVADDASNYGGIAGALYVSGGEPEVVLDLCEFRANNASRIGGAVYYDAGGSLTVNRTRVVENWARYGGGGIGVSVDDGQVKVVESVFEENIVYTTASWSNNFYEGGGLSVYGESQITVQSSTFSRNGAENGGGMLVRGKHSVVVHDTLFEENLSSAYGGGLVLTTSDDDYNSFNASFTNTTFLSNWCGGSGGGMFAAAGGSGNVSFIESTFAGNSVVYRSDVPRAASSFRGGAYLASGANLSTVASNCVFEDNEAGAVGGAIAVDGGMLSASDCDFSDNQANDGGAINAFQDDDESPAIVYIRGGTVRRNIAITSFCDRNSYYYCSNGGAIRADAGAEVTLDGFAVEECSANFGGAISISDGARVSCSNMTFSSNEATVAGGAVQVWGNGSRLLTEKCLFVGNSAQGIDDGTEDSASATSGLSAASSSSTTSTSVSQPARDGAGASGGAIAITDGGSVLMTDSELSENDADGRGGGVYCGEAANVTLIRVDFDGHRSGVGGNEEGHGGACAAVDGCEVLLVDSTFSRNSALHLGPSGGAVSAEGGSEVSVTRCLFYENQASGGGAVYGGGGGTRLTMQDCTLEGNRATKEGGALRAYMLGFLSMESCNFDSNDAGELGGGVHCYECVMSANNCSFSGNLAYGDGGAMRLSYASTVTVNRCRFTANEAVYDGGAIAVDAAAGRVGSAELLSAATQPQNGTDDGILVDLACFNTTFHNNVAGERGGSLYSTANSAVELRDCNSTENSASLGGSIYMAGSEYVLAKSLFSGDTVPTEATIFAVGADVRAKDVTFADTTNNSGMLSVYAGSNTLFRAQDCSFVGWIGSNVVLAASTGRLQLDSCDFSQSTAQKLVSVEDGDERELAIVRNSRLGTGNYAAINYGKDLESTGANSSAFGINLATCDTDTCSDDGCEEGDLGVYCNCYESTLDFATICLGKTGTLELSTSASVVSTMYPENPQAYITVAGNGTEEGGPILWKLDWTNDAFSVGWTAVPSTGLAYPGELTTVSLEGQVAKFWNGLSSTLITVESPYQADVDPSAVVVNASFVYCAQGEYWDGRNNSCRACALVDLNPEGLDCDEEGFLLETLPLAKGYWRSVATSTTIRECFNDDACVGSKDGVKIVTADEYCADGYTGPYCAVCMEGYTTGVSHTCHSCDSSFRAGMVVIMALTGVILVVGIVIVINDLVGNPALTDLSETPFSTVSRRLRRIPFHKLKIPLVVFQVMTQYASITSIEFPPVFQTFLSAISVINLDLGWLFSSVCMVDVNFHGRLVAATVGPLLLLVVLLGTYLYTCKKHGLQPPPREVADQAMYPVPGYRPSPHSSDTEPEHSVLRRVQDKHATVALTMAFLLYSTVSTVVFQTFTCDDLEDVGMRYLRADYAIDCDSDRHKAFETYATAMIVVYPIGIPLTFLVLLFRKRRIINPPKEVHPDVVSLAGSQNCVDAGDRDQDARLGDRRIAQTAFLWRAYRPGAYYFEVVECIRRLLLTGCLVFILPNSAGQAAVACVLSVLTVTIFAFVHPYSDPNDHRAYTLGALAIFLTMFMGLVVRVNLADEETQSQRILAGLLVALTVGLLVVAVVECLWEARRLSQGVRDDDDDAHVFLRRETKPKEGPGDEKYKTGGALYAPKLCDMAMNKALGAKSSNNSSTSDEKVLAAGGGGGVRQRGSQMFMLSSTAEPDHKPHVAIAGTSSRLHPSTGTLVQPTSSTQRGSSGLGVAGGEGMVAFRSLSGSHSPLHSRRDDHPRKDGGGAGSGVFVPAEAEGAPEGIEMEIPLSAGGSVGGGGVGRQSSSRSKRGSAGKSSRRDSGSRSSRRRARNGRGGMRPAMPAAGPSDEMRPSPDPSDTYPPGPWMS